MLWTLLFCSLVFVQATRIVALKGIATVEIIKRSERSATADYDYEYDVSLSAFDATHRLKLRSADPILSANFKYHEIDLDENGQTVFTDLTPSIRTLREFQDTLYIDREKDAAVRLRAVDGNFDLQGLVNGARIRRQDGEHVAERPENSKPKYIDYVDFHRAMSQPRAFLMEKVMTATPEIAAVFDYENSKLFNFDRMLIIEYLAIMFNSVNNRYALNTDPKIVCTLVAVHIIKTRSAQPFIENSINPGGQDYDIFKMLIGFGAWAFTNKLKIPRHDILPLIAGALFESSGINGLAPLNGACWFDHEGNSSAAIPVTQDIGGYFKGSFTLAHELAHTLGAPHDTVDGDCPFSDGYLMSYEGWGTINKFALSKCSQQLIKAFVASSGGVCLLSAGTGPAKTEVLSSTLQVGDKVNMKKYCEKAMNNRAATVAFEPNADVSCRSVKCQLQLGKNAPLQTTPFSFPAGNNAPCGQNGICHNGYCVRQKTKRPDQLKYSTKRI